MTCTRPSYVLPFLVLLALTGCRRGDEAPAASPASPTASAPAAPSGACTFDAGVQPITNWPALLLATDPSMGKADAAVTVVEFFEPNCPHCAAQHPVMQEAIRLHGDRARFVFKPVVWTPNSILQGQALYAAAAEGKFAEMMDRQMRGQKPEGLSEADVRAMAQAVGMNADAMMQAINAGTYRGTMMAQREAFDRTGLQLVPAILINGRLIGADHSAACIGQLIDQSLETTPAGAAPADAPPAGS